MIDPFLLERYYPPGALTAMLRVPARSGKAAFMREMGRALSEADRRRHRFSRLRAALWCAVRGRL